MVRDYKGIIYLFLFLISLSTVSATFYQYDKKITITDSDGSYMGYVEPYYISSIMGDYTYLKWQRQGFIEGNSWPVYLVEGTTTTLPFGIEGEILRVKINSVSSSGVDLDIDKSDILTEIENIPDTLPENTEAIVKETENQVNTALENFQDLIDNIIPRANKAANRAYHSSLHVLGAAATNAERSASQSIMQEEVRFAQRASDKAISLLIDALAAGSGIAYTTAVSLIPGSVRADLTKFFYNIGSTTDSKSQSSLASDGSFTLYFGSPSHNKVSASFNNRLKSMNLPYFNGNEIVGKRTYKEGGIGIIAAIPEETSWSESTLENRWNNDKIRFYETMIAGIGDDGVKAAGQWYEDMLEQSGNLITSFSSLSDGEFDTGDIFKVITDNAQANPKSSIAGFALLQGWMLSGAEVLQNPDFNKVDSLGYVVIVKKNGNSYDILETHTIFGNRKEYYLDPYESMQETVKAAEEVQQAVQKVKEASKDIPTAAVVAAPEPAKSSPAKATGNVVKEEEKEEKGFFTTVGEWFNGLWKRWFG